MSLAFLMAWTANFGIVMLKSTRPHQPVTDALAAHIEDSFRVEAGVDRQIAA